MSFKVDYSQAEASELLPEGEYECIIKQVSQAVTRKGTPYISFLLSAREDVAENPKKGAVLYHSLWQRKEPTAADLACEGYSIKQILSISIAAGLENGKNYENIEAWCQDLAERQVRVTVYHDTYQGQTRARISWFNPTQYPNKQLQGQTEFTELEDEDSDVPF